MIPGWLFTQLDHYERLVKHLDESHRDLLALSRDDTEFRERAKKLAARCARLRTHTRQLISDLEADA